jgi:hypothetical protein
LNRLKNNELAIEERDAITTDVVPKRRMKSSEVKLGEGRSRREAIKQELCVGILSVSCGPVQRRRDRSSSRDGVDEGASDELGWRVGRVNRSEKMDVDEMVDKMGTELERTASRQQETVIRRDCSWGESSQNGGRG